MRTHLITFCRGKGNSPAAKVLFGGPMIGDRSEMPKRNFILVPIMRRRLAVHGIIMKLCAGFSWRRSKGMLRGESQRS